MNIVRAEGFAPAAVTIDVDVSSAWYEHGTRALLVENAFVEVTGSWDGDGNVFNALKVEFK